MTDDNDANAGAGDESRNDDRQAVHDTLVGKVTDLAKQVGRAPDGNTADTLVREVDELNHRVTLVGNLLFTAETKAITAAMDKVRAAETDVDDAIKRADDL